jgi:hypothetical protein
MIRGKRWTPVTGIVTGTGTLDLDDVGAKVTEQHRGIRRSQHPAEICDDDPRQRAGRRTLRTGVNHWNSLGGDQRG